MNWLEAFPAIVVAVVLLLAPGLLATAPLRVSLVGRMAVSGLTSVACFGLAGVVSGVLGVAFSPWHLAPFAIASFLALKGLGARQRQPIVEKPGSRPWAAATAWAVSSLIVCVVAFAGVPSPRHVSQTYDNVFHLSAVAAILDGRSASSLTLRTLIETDRARGYYPSGWHTIVATISDMTGADIAVSVNAAWVGVALALWLPGAVWLTTTVLVAWPPARTEIVAFPLAAGFASMPFALLSWGTLYPTFLATALLPAAIAIPLHAFRAIVSTKPAFRWRAATLGAVGVATAVAAIAFSQPRVLASWVLLLAIPTLVGAVRLLRSAWRAGGARRRYAVWSLVAAGTTLVLSAAAAFAYLVYGLGLFERPIGDRLGGPQAAATQSVVAGLIQVAVQDLPSGVSEHVVGPSLLVAGVLATGFARAARSPGLRWICVSYVAVAVLYALAAGSDDVVSKLLTGIWYKDRYRLSSLLPVLGVPLASLGVLTIAGWLKARAPKRFILDRSHLWITSAVAASSGLILLLGGATAAIGTVFSLPDKRATNEVVSQAQIDFMRRLPDIVPADQKVLGDPWDGSAWTQVFGDREPVFPHVNGQWDADRQALAARLDHIDDDEAVCSALDRLRVRYVLYNPHEFGGGDPAGNLFSAIHRAVEKELFTEVVTDGETVLYRIDQCGPLPIMETSTP